MKYTYLFQSTVASAAPVGLRAPPPCKEVVKSRPIRSVGEQFHARMWFYGRVGVNESLHLGTWGVSPGRNSRELQLDSGRVPFNSFTLSL